MSRRNLRPKRGDDGLTPTVKDVAKQASVSIATVSRVLAGGDGVSRELAERVREAVRAVNYHPNHLARNLRARVTRTIGVVIPNIENAFFTGVVRGIERVLRASDYTLLLGNSDDDPAVEQLYLATLRAEKVAGIIFTPVNQDAAAYQTFLDAGLPLAGVDIALPGLGIDLVTAANTEGARAGVKHLVDLGHARIGFVSGPARFSTARERRTGYEQALSEAGLPLDGEFLAFGDFREAGGYKAMQELLKRRRRPTSVLVANNLMVLGAIQAILEAGLRIPSDIAIVGFDDMPWAVSLHPPLTVIAQPTYELGATAARLLLARLREPDRPTHHVVLGTSLIVRASCGGKEHVEALSLATTRRPRPSGINGRDTKAGGTRRRNSP